MNFKMSVKGIQTLMQTGDLQTYLFQSNKLSWFRDESLNHIEDIHFVKYQEKNVEEDEYEQMLKNID